MKGNGKKAVNGATFSPQSGASRDLNSPFNPAGPGTAGPEMAVMGICWIEIWKKKNGPRRPPRPHFLGLMINIVVDTGEVVEVDTGAVVVGIGVEEAVVEVVVGVAGTVVVVVDIEAVVGKVVDIAGVVIEL